jgi:crossover junction endodeoxyribonuclease RuvC
MRIFGIDCGSEITGYGIVECPDAAHHSGLSDLQLIAFGGIRPAKKLTLAERLAFVHHELLAQLAAHQPDLVAVEEVFYSVNAKSALKLGHVRGVALLAAATAGLPIAEYAPLTIKSTVTGYGLAQKEQVQFMVARLLHMPEPPEPADAADALAIAICHIHHAQTFAAQHSR